MFQDLLINIIIIERDLMESFDLLIVLKSMVSLKNNFMSI